MHTAAAKQKAWQYHCSALVHLSRCVCCWQMLAGPRRAVPCMPKEGAPALKAGARGPCTRSYMKEYASQLEKQERERLAQLERTKAVQASSR